MLNEHGAGQAKPAATDTFVSIDAFRVGEDLFDTPEGDYRWQPNCAFEDAPSEYDRTDLRSSQVAFRFRGTGVTLFTVQGPSYGRFTVLIDGKPAGLFDATRRPPVTLFARVGTWHDPDLGRPIAAPLERCAELLGVDLVTICGAATTVEPYVRADGTSIWSLMRPERQLRPEAYGRRRGGYLDRRRTPATDA